MAFDPEVNRALARELYVESTVNEVNPRSKKSPGKIKPGQMNVFNPRTNPEKDRQILDSLKEETKGLVPSRTFRPSGGFKGTLTQIQQIMHDKGGNGRLKNEEL